MEEKSIPKDLAKSLETVSKSTDNLVYTIANYSDNRPWKAAGIGLIKGLAFGFGSVLGATVIVALFVLILSKIQLVPVIGDFFKNILEYMQNSGYKGV